MGGLGRCSIIRFLAKVQETPKLPQSLKPLIFKGFGGFFGVFGVIEICIEKTSILPAKIVPTGREMGWAWVGGNPKNPKKLHEVLDFQRFTVLG